MQSPRSHAVTGSAPAHRPAVGALRTAGTADSMIAMAKRPRSEDCKHLTLADVRPLVEPGAEVLVLADGTELSLSWGTVRGCFGGDRAGRALLLICPSCGHNARVLHRPPARALGCWKCTPVSRRSHRRPGARAGQPKPNSWRRAQIATEQRRCADLLGLPRRPGAPRISRLRAVGLALRLEGLDAMRWTLPDPRLGRLLERSGYGRLQAPSATADLQNAAALRLQATAWAMRRPSRDRRRPVVASATVDKTEKTCPEGLRSS